MTLLFGGATQNQINPSFNGTNGIENAALTTPGALTGDALTALVTGGANLLNTLFAPKPPTQFNSTPIVTVTQRPPGTTTTGTAPVYNQPYTDNSQSIAVSLPDMFSAQPMLPAPQMKFDSLPGVSPMQVARPVTPAAQAPMIASTSIGALAAPMAPPTTVAVGAQGRTPINLMPQQARSDQPLPPVSPEPLARPSRPIEAPPMAPRYAPPPPQMAPQMPYGNPYARPQTPAPPPPMMNPGFNPGRFMPNLQPPGTFYQPPPPPKPGFLARLGRGLQSAGESMNPNIAYANAARAKAMTDLRMKAMEMDSSNWRNAADNTTAIMREMMQQGGQDRRTQFTQDNENYRAQLSTAAQGRLSQSQGYEMLGEALKMAPQNQADYAQKFAMLDGASRALGQDFTGMINQTNTEGSNAVLKQAVQMKRDAMAMLREQNDLQMQPIENDIKRLQRQNAQNNADMAPVEAASKLASLQKTSLETAALRDPVMQEAKRAEALAKSADVQRRGEQDAFAAIQKKAQMGATLIGQANQMLANPLAMFDGAAKARANQLIQQGQALQQEAFVSYQRPLLKPPSAGTPLKDMSIVEKYKMITGGDVNKAKEFAKADGWVLPNLPAASPKIGMK